MNIEIGSKIQSIRKDKNLTIKDVSMMSSVAVSLISQIENNKANPSLSTLIAIAKSLEVNVADFFKDERTLHSDIVVRSTERIKFREGVKSTYYLLTNNLYSEFECLYCEYEKDGCSTEDLVEHDVVGYETGFVISGKLKVELGDDVYILNPGDSISYAGTTRHKISNMYDGVSIAVWMDTPPNF